jgi:hypothetical protein
MPRAGKWAIAMVVTVGAFPLGFIVVPILAVDRDIALSVASLLSSVAAMPLSVWASKEKAPAVQPVYYAYPPPGYPYPPAPQSPAPYPQSPAPYAQPPAASARPGAWVPPQSPSYGSPAAPARAAPSHYGFVSLALGIGSLITVACGTVLGAPVGVFAVVTGIRAFRNRQSLDAGRRAGAVIGIVAGVLAILFSVAWTVAIVAGWGPFDN